MVHNHTTKGEIGHLKEHFRQKMVSNKVTKCLWDYILVHQADILSRIACGKMGRMGIDEVTG